MSLRQLPLRVLIVDDRRDLATAIQKALILSGQTADVAYDGESAIELARTLPLDVVLCDLEMPGMNGFELIQRLRGEPDIPPLPMCAFSGRSDDAYRHLAMECGFDAYLVKTISFVELLAFLERYRRVGKTD
jgi:DNA-binding response OmpR family regulator